MIRKNDTCCRKNSVYVGILVSLMLGVVFISGCVGQQIEKQNRPCRLPKVIYKSQYHASSEQDAKNILSDFFKLQNMSVVDRNITAEKITLFMNNHYKLTYHVCGTLNDIMRVPTGDAATYRAINNTSFYCSDIVFEIKDDELIGQSITPC